MNCLHYPAERLIELFHRHTIATLPELMEALTTSAERTVSRRLAELPYRCSYSHRGAYYTLDELARFDAHGLWSYHDVHFSRYGRLLDTAAEMTSGAPAGYFTEELEALVHVPPQDALRQLVERGRLQRRPSPERYLYGSADRARWQEQWAARQAQADELPAALALFYSLLDEQQRRLYAGLESLPHGPGGDRRIAELLGLDVATVARGRHELLSGEVLRERIRREGGGRKRVEKNGRNPEHPPLAAGSGHRGRSDGPAGCVDRPAVARDQSSVAPAGPAGGAQHGAPAARQTRFCPARQPPESVLVVPRTQSAVPLYQASTPSLQCGACAHYQRRRQEARTGRPVQESRAGLEP